MSSTQADDLLESINQEVDPEIDQKSDTSTVIDTQAEQADFDASKILANDSQEESSPQKTTENVPETISRSLKTRQDLINEIRRQASIDGSDVSKLNLNRRRKNSLKRILGERCAQFAERQSRPQMDAHMESMMPEDLDEREKFCVSLLYRFDLTCCKLLEHGVDYTRDYHGMTVEGFANSIDENEVLQEEIKSAWSDILANEENRWVLEYCGPGSRLAMCHLYSLANCARMAPTKKQKHMRYVQNENAQREKIQVAPRGMGPQPSRGKLFNAVRRQQASRKIGVHPLDAHQQGVGLVKQI